MIVHPIKCFKTLYPVQFVNQMGKKTKSNIFWHLYKYLFMYTYSMLTVLRFLRKPSFTMLYSSFKYGGIFSPKRATKKDFYGGDFFRTKLWRGVYEGTNDQIM